MNLNEPVDGFDVCLHETCPTGWREKVLSGQSCRKSFFSSVNMSMSLRNMSMGLHNLSTGLVLFGPNLFDSFSRQSSNLNIG